MDEEVSQVVSVQVVKFTALKQFSDFVVTLCEGNSIPLYLHGINFTNNLSDTALRSTNEFAVTS